MIDDRALVRRILDGDLPAFRLLISNHQRLVFHMISRVVKNKEEQEELCQDVFLRVHDKLGEFSFQSKLSTWIATIAYRHAINHLRKQKIFYADLPEDENLANVFVDAINPEVIVGEADMDKFVMRMIDHLPAQYKTVLLLFHVEEMKYPEICEITGMPEGTVKNYLFRARHLLKEKVKKYLDNDII